MSPAWGANDPSAPDVQRKQLVRERSQDYSDKLRLRARRSTSPNFRRTPLPGAATPAATATSFTASPYLPAVSRTPRPLTQALGAAAHEASEWHEGALLGGASDWCSRHHITWSMNNAALPRLKRIYFDPLPQVRVVGGEYSDVGMHWPDSGDDTNRHGMQRRWQMRHYPFKAPEPMLRAALARHPAVSSSSEAHSRPPQAREPLTLPRLAEREERQAEDGSPRDPKASEKPKKAKTRNRTFSTAKSVMASVPSASVLTQFVDWCHEKYGHMVRLFRILDKDGNMRLSKQEFTTGLTQLMYRKDLARLWDCLDRDRTGWISFLHFAVEDAVILAYFKHWADVNYGGATEVFHTLDTCRDGKLSFSEFSEGVKRLGFTTYAGVCVRTLFELIDDAGDVSNKRQITQDELAFLDRWDCPEYMWETPDFDAKDSFLKAVFGAYRNNPLLAWRKALDTDSSMRVSYYEFVNAYKGMSQKGIFPATLARSVPALFLALDCSKTGWVSLREFDEPTYASLTAFSAWAKNQYGKVSACCKALAGPDGGDRVAFKNFRKVVKTGLGLESEEAWKLFEGLSLESKKDGTIKPDELFFLDRWEFAAELEEELCWEKMMFQQEQLLSS